MTVNLEWKHGAKKQAEQEKQSTELFSKIDNFEWRMIAIHWLLFINLAISLVIAFCVAFLVLQ